MIMGGGGTNSEDIYTVMVKIRITRILRPLQHNDKNIQRVSGGLDG